MLGFIFYLENIVPHIKGFHGRIKHAVNNIVISSLNGIINGFLFAGVTLTVISLADLNSFGLLNLINMPYHLEAVLGFIFFDLWMYLWHIALHRIPLLWRFHRMHHSDIQMDTTSALRFHPGEIIFSSSVRLAIIPLLGIDFFHLFIYEIVLNPIIFFHHSNVGLPENWDRIFRAVIVTPNMHRIHHSQEVFETNSNYGSIFSFWDRLLNTFKKRDDTRTIRYGLKIFQESEWQILWGMLLTPFKQGE